MQPYQYFQIALSALAFGASVTYFQTGRNDVAGAYLCYGFASLCYAFL